MMNSSSAKMINSQKTAHLTFDINFVHSFRLLEFFSGEQSCNLSTLVDDFLSLRQIPLIAHLSTH